jgi:hypothetical protein
MERSKGDEEAKSQEDTLIIDARDGEDLNLEDDEKGWIQETNKNKEFITAVKALKCNQRTNPECTNSEGTGNISDRPSHNKRYMTYQQMRNSKKIQSPDNIEPAYQPTRNSKKIQSSDNKESTYQPVLNTKKIQSPDHEEPAYQPTRDTKKIQNPDNKEPAYQPMQNSEKIQSPDNKEPAYQPTRDTKKIQNPDNKEPAYQQMQNSKKKQRPDNKEPTYQPALNTNKIKCPDNKEPAYQPTRNTKKIQNPDNKQHKASLLRKRHSQSIPIQVRFLLIWECKPHEPPRQSFPSRNLALALIYLPIDEIPIREQDDPPDSKSEDDRAHYMDDRVESE